MKDQFDGGAEIDFEEFQGWLTQMAAQEGTSTEAILERLVSTYWIANELSETLSEGDHSNVDPPSETRDDENLTEELVEAIKHITEDQNTPSTVSVDPAMIQLVQALQAGNHPSQPTGQSPDPGFASLQQSLASIETELKKLHETPTGAHERDQTEERIDEIERTFDVVYKEVRDVLDATNELAHETAEDVEDIRSDISVEASQRAADIERVTNQFEEVQDRVSSLDMKVKAVSNGIEENRAELDQAIDSFQETIDEIESYLEGVHERLDGVDNARGELIDVLDSRLTSLLERDAERERLDQIFDTAHTEGLTEANCESCGETIALGVLASPACPHCNRQFSGLDVKRKFLRSRAILQTMAPGSTVDVEGIGPTLSGGTGTDQPLPSANRD